MFMHFRRTRRGRRLDKLFSAHCHVQLLLLIDTRPRSAKVFMVETIHHQNANGTKLRKSFIRSQNKPRAENNFTLPPVSGTIRNHHRIHDWTSTSQMPTAQNAHYDVILPRNNLFSLIR